MTCVLTELALKEIQNLPKKHVEELLGINFRIGVVVGGPAGARTGTAASLCSCCSRRLQYKTFTTEAPNENLTASTRTPYAWT